MTSDLLTQSNLHPSANSRLRILTPWVCRAIFVLIMLAGAAMHVRYLNHNCPLGLSEDEAHYWDWSRQLGLSYYSKGPMVAYLIRGSCAIFGDTMPAVRYPAILLSLGTALLSYWLIVKLFASDRLALGWALLSMTIPAFVAGSVLMTIDSPFFFFWALATCLAAKGIFDSKDYFWPLVGVALGLGFLAKYTIFVWPLCLIPFFIFDRPARRLLRSGWFWSMIPVALVFTTPVVIFNAQHHWVTVNHVHADTSAGFSWTNWPQFILSQIGIMGLFIFIILVGAVVYVFRQGRDDPHRRALYFLASIGVTFFAIVGCMAFSTTVEPNWPVCAYFTLLILAVYFLSRRLGNGPHKWWWRGNLILAVVTGAIVMPIAHDFSILYPVIGPELPAINRILARFGQKHPKTLSNFDPTYKLRGWDQLGDQLAALLRQHPGAMVMGEDYQTASELAFYTPGHPKTFAVGSYFARHTKRFSQFDLWPDRSLKPSNKNVVGRDAIYVGYMNPTLRDAFDSVTRLPPVDIKVDGYELRSFTVWFCHDFHGMTRPGNIEF